LRVNDDSFYPDIFITCQPIAPNATQATDASVVVEVASDSTRIYDATTKLESYSQLPSIQEIVLVEIETRLVTVHRPRLHQVDTYTEHDAIALARWSLRLADIYAGIDL
ncbi:MAG: Uma2 family endonuclease, partial [Gammaproteobacteria bacterium]